jgi:hypothetical protein
MGGKLIIWKGLGIKWWWINADTVLIFTPG